MDLGLKMTWEKFFTERFFNCEQHIPLLISSNLDRAEAPKYRPCSHRRYCGTMCLLIYQGGSIMQNRSFLMLALWLPIVIVSHYIQFTLPLHGEQIASISCLTFVLPLAAALVPGVRTFAVIPFLWLCFHAGAPLPWTMGIPTLLAALSWQLSGDHEWRGTLFHVAIPIAAMATFIACCPGAWAYTLYWLIPIACLFAPRNAMTRALQSTFVAHAAGSVIWAYCVPLTDVQWLSLIPIVALERLLVATMSAGLLLAMTLAGEMVKRRAVKAA